jgi:hypothetical protein
MLGGPDSIMYIQLCTWIHHFHRHYSVYESQSRKQGWLSRLLFSIDLLVQEQLCLLQDQYTPLESIHYRPITDGFVQLQDEVIRRKLLSSLPDDLATLRSSASKKRKSSEMEYDNKINKDDKGGEHKRPSSSPYKRDNNYVNTSQNSQTVQNKNKNSCWLLPQDKSFTEAFIKSGLIHETPTYNSTPFCLQFFTKGFCTRGENCRLSHDDPRDVRLDRNFSAFISKAYGTTNSSESKQPSTPNQGTHRTNPN